MLVQQRLDGSVRLVRQHDHALLAGELAATWTGVGRGPAPLGFELVLATALHDIAWRELDETPELDPESGRPHAFHTYPLEAKLAAYGRGLDELVRLHPYAALLGSLHYTSFPEVEAEAALQADESARREALLEALGLEEGEERIVRDLAFLKLFDSLSIFLCLTPPSASTAEQPEWVESARHLATPGGATVHFTWIEDDVVHADPFPFRDALEVRVPYRDLAGGFADRESLQAAWEDAADEVWWLCVRPAPRLA